MAFMVFAAACQKPEKSIGLKEKINIRVGSGDTPIPFKEATSKWQSLTTCSRFQAPDPFRIPCALTRLEQASRKSGAEFWRPFSRRFQELLKRDQPIVEKI